VYKAKLTGNNNPGACVHYYFASFSLLIQVPFRFQSMATLKEGDQSQMWEFIPVLLL
jgi:hypothetical protein